MADVFVAYSSTDRATVEKLIGLLELRWSVWWDDLIIGDFDVAIESAIADAKCLLVLWSASSREKPEVKDEVRLAQQAGIPVIAAKVSECVPPYGFQALSFSDLIGWDGDPAHPAFRQLLRRLSVAVPPRMPATAPVRILSGRLALPSLFLSVSSHETQLAPGPAVQALRVHKAPSILVSAYDAIGARRDDKMLRELESYREEGGFVLVDSGNYEATRLRDKSWSPADLAEALSRMPHDCVFCFDELRPVRDVEEAVAQVQAAVERDQKHTAAPVLPIVHARQFPKRGFDTANLPLIIKGVAEQLEPALIAVPERELGAGLIERARTMTKIRQTLADLPFYQPIHLLGTGNPWSVAVLAAAGADSFDGLEWCRVAVDHDSGRLHHYQHFDFFRYQAELSDSPITKAALRMRSVTFPAKVAFHNLDYFSRLSEDLVAAASKRDFKALVVGMLGQANTKQLKRDLPGILP